MVERPYFLEPGSIREDWRLGVAGLFASGDGVKANPGVLTGMGVSQTGTASGSVLVGAGWCVNQASSGTGGAFLECLDSQATLDVFGVNPPASSPRNDLIVYQSGTSPKLRVVPGTPSATPTDPTIPAQATVLARVRVKAGSAYGATPAIVSGDIDDLRERTSLRGRAPVVQVFTGNGTWRKPPGCVGAQVRVVGGGGGGGMAEATPAGTTSAGCGGQGGGYAESVLRVDDLPATVAVTVGSGGLGGRVGQQGIGQDGGASSFGSLVSAAGGRGGSHTGAASTAGAIGGAQSTQALTGQVTVAGSGGGAGVRVGTSGLGAIGGTGGNAVLGAGGAGMGGSNNGHPGQRYGGGGGGGTNNANQGAKFGGDGAAGVVIVSAYF